MGSNAAEQVIDGKLTGLLADGTWAPMAAVHFATMTGALFAGWIPIKSSDVLNDLNGAERLNALNALGSPSQARPKSC